ncbi:MAG: hypothetical protein ACUVWK_03435 [Nitrososphaerales archaeon]
MLEGLTVNTLSKIFPTLAPGTATALIGPPFSGKSTTCMEIILEKIDRMPPIFFVIDQPIHIIRNLLGRIMNAEQMEKLKLIDGYSWMSGGRTKSDEVILSIEDLGKPSDISVAISSAICQTGGKALFILDSFEYRVLGGRSSFT